MDLLTYPRVLITWKVTIVEHLSRKSQSTLYCFLHYTAYKNRTTYEDKTAYKDETAQKDETVYEDKTAYEDETPREDQIVHKDETARNYDHFPRMNSPGLVPKERRNPKGNFPLGAV